MCESRKLSLAVFDVEGVLIPKNRYLLFEVSRGLSFKRFLTVAFYGLLYEVGLVSLKFALKRIFRVFRGFTVKHFLEFLRRVPLMPDVEVTFEKLKELGFKTALISSGLPDFVVADLASRLGADYAFGLRLETTNGVVTGEVSGEVIEKKGKLPTLCRILKTEGLKAENCVIVADDRNNLPMMLPKALKIGVNPDFIISFKVDYAVSGELSEILPLIGMEKLINQASSSRNGMLREAIHACGFTVPFLSSFLGLHTVVILILAVTILYSSSMIAAIEGRHVPIFSTIIRNAATPGETHSFAFAPVFFALGILASMILFPRPACCAAVATFALGDSAASFFGKHGRKRLPFNKLKTLEGSAAGLLFGFAGALFFVPPIAGLAAAIIAMLVEALPLPVNDNITIPLAAAAAAKLVLGI